MLDTPAELSERIRLHRIAPVLHAPVFHECALVVVL